MPAIRPLEDHDLAAIVQLLDARLPGWMGDEGFLREMLLDHPWANPETPSLVAVGDGGAIVGFLGAHPRRVRFGGRLLNGVCCSHLVVAPPPTGGAAGALLLGHLLRGPQAVTWSDTAIDAVVRIWQTFGGQLDHARACDWMIVLRPLHWLRSGVSNVLRRRSLEDVMPVYALPGHIRGYERPSLDATVSSRDVGPAEVLERLPVPGTKWPLAQVEHDAAHLEHMFRLIRRRLGSLECRLVTRGENAIGWYAYTSSKGRAARALHLCAAPEHADAVLGDLVEQATASGAPALAGRLEPHLDRALSRRIAVMGFARRPVIHAREPELRATLATNQSLLTQLDSEWFGI